MTDTLLNKMHCKEVLEHKLLIGASKTFNNLPKTFMYSPYTEEYIIYRNGKKHSSCLQPALQQLLDTYNKL